MTRTVAQVFLLVALVPLPATDTAIVAPVVPASLLNRYVQEFNALDQEDVVNAIPDAEAAGFLLANVPLFECPDPVIERTYYFRWWTYRKHIRATPEGFVVSEFLPKVGWASRYNTINCPVGHHLYEGRWISDPKYLDGYTRHYFSKGGEPGGRQKLFSNWITDAVHARFLVNGDRGFAVGLLDALIANHEAWDQDTGGGPWKKSRLLENGLYWQVDSWEGQEYSIGGTGARPPINSYMFADALAISRLAGMAGRDDLAKKYQDKAERLRTLVQNLLWDPDARFFKTLRHKDAPTNQYGNGAAEACEPNRLVGVREMFGYVPWQFNLPVDGKGYEEAWKPFVEAKGFRSPHGLTVAERRHPRFNINRGGCSWNGASWPFVTSQALTALANLLNNYHQEVIGKKAYCDALLTYAGSHVHTREDGTSVPWLDESLNPDTGKWIMNWLDKGAKFPATRGRYYNHSTFCDLVITGLVGLRPRADEVIEVNPLVPDEWGYFCLDRIPYHGHRLTILWDRSGDRYRMGKGLHLLLDGREIASAGKPGRVTGTMNRE